jgi:hypothetical protein
LIFDHNYEQKITKLLTLKRVYVTFKL